MFLVVFIIMNLMVMLVFVGGDGIYVCDGGDDNVDDD